MDNTQKSYNYDLNDNLSLVLTQDWFNSSWTNNSKGLYSYNNPTATDNKNDYAPLVFKLMQNYPNPFNPSTIISYSLALESKVTIKIYNLLGQEIKTLVNRTESTGNHQITFNAGDLPSGIYLYRMQAGDYIQIKKMVLLK